MGVCSVIGCKSRSKERRLPHRALEGVTFHAFPSKNVELRARWCLAIRGPGWAPSKHAKVCSKHFEERCFDRSGQTCRLRENAMPTVGIDPSRLAMANAHAKMEYMEGAGVDTLAEGAPLGLGGHGHGHSHGHSSAFVNVVAEAVLNAGNFRCENHEEVLSAEECNKLMYALDLGDGRKIKLIYSVPRGQCVNLF